ncbi:MAG TPA: MlaE family lipid ABC transporter permease subunit [Smithellaceae bacterium]|jgi:phospholipid/cholesterol/gamma-HCH transport system permease protein|nr:MlaE family lipid ABC transporter permease subunit [Syntrophaceae bacterium]MDX9816978.1 MlaE family lipid ABC transporter permease subunit [Smithellaceae bacterium]MBP8609611.1 MlaE family lipid ABC transporter permease subunit [Syntrophaceae bacterium]HOD30047.1 MlaE family lipid ABC transporter permease subunit [Smithellaceae bacterium]HOM69120.1 MlaE family lipid ABC transporter permease subunit [Smithellaceae bacterium]
MSIEQNLSQLCNVSSDKKNEHLFIYLTGSFSLKNLNEFTDLIHATVKDEKPQETSIDFSGIAYLDSAAALALIQIQKFFQSNNMECSFVNLTGEAQRIFSVIHEQALIKTPLKTKTKQDFFLIQTGDAFLQLVRDFIEIIEFVGNLLFAFFYTILHPRTLRINDVLFYMRRAGVDGLPIVGLISVLIGLIIAFMSFLQLKQIGANIYVPSLVSFAMVKELGPIMTAILVAGRSGSAFAAEIGTMMVNEEVDALQTMGFDPIRFLAVPKVLAAIIVVPILTVYSDFFGVVGGLIVGVTGLDLTVNTYISQSIKTIKVFDIVTSLIKAAVFAALIASIGCQRGFKVRSGAQDVGKFTTSAVVSAIFLIVVTDSIFAVTLYYLR